MTLPSPTDRMAIIHLGHDPAPDNAVVVGQMKEVMEYIPQSIARQDAVEELEKARFSADQISSMQQKTRAVQASILADNVNHLCARLDTFLQHRAERARADAEREEEEEAQRIQDELAQLPDPDNPDPLGDLPRQGSGEHTNTGDLHSLPAKLPADQTEFELPEDPTGTIIPQPAALEFDEV